MPRLRVRHGGQWLDSDLSGKVRFNGADLAFAPPIVAPAGVSLFTNQVPFGLDNADGTDNYTLGSYITPSVAGTVTHIRWPFPITAQPGGVAPKANVWRTATSAKVGGADVPFAMPGVLSTLGVPAWNQVALNTPVHFAAGEEMCAAVWTPLRYVASSGGASPWPLANGVLSVPQNGGRFTSGASGQVDFPASNFNNGCYFVDVVFVPDA